MYLLRGPGLRRLTADHTLAAALAPAGARRAARYPDGVPDSAPSRHRLARCLGMEGDATPDVRTIDLQAGDRLLLCTDGVTGALPDRLIAHLLRHQGSPDEACRVLTGAAGRAGGQDDATAVVAFVDALPSCRRGRAGGRRGPGRRARRARPKGGEGMPTDFVIRTGDLLSVSLLQPVVVPALVAPVPLVGTGVTVAAGGPAVCLEGDELPPVLRAALPYISPPFVTPGMGTLTVTLTPANKTLQTMNGRAI